MDVPERISRFVLKEPSMTVDALASRAAISRTSAGNYLSRMKRAGLVEREGPGSYRPARRKADTIRPPPAIGSLLAMLSKAFPDLDPVVWWTSLASPYLQNAALRELVVFDIPQPRALAIAEFLRDRDKLVFVDPTPDELSAFAWSGLGPVFIFARNEREATEVHAGLRVATLERVWLDLYFLVTRKRLPFPLGELGGFLANALREGAISVSRLMRYAERRGLREEVCVLLYRIGIEADLDAIRSLLPFEDRSVEWVEEVVRGAVEGV